MSSYEVRRPERARPSIVVAAAMAVLALGVLAATYRPFLTFVVALDGRDVSVYGSTTVGDVVAAAGQDVSPGDLVAADDGSVVIGGGGTPALITRGGRSLSRDAKVWPAERLASSPGTDVVEGTATRETPIPAGVLEIGGGPVARLVREGRAGKALVTVGTVSGHEVSRTVLAEPVEGKVVRSGGSTGLRVVSLTFDDGPSPGQTERVLDILAAEDVRATFFMLGANVARHPRLARRVVAEGHEVGNHTWSHTTDGSTPADVAKREVDRTQRAIRKATGVSARWFRPPGGRIGPGLTAAARARGMRIVRWTVDPWDWSRPGEAVLAERVVAATKPGSIVLLHDGGGDRSQTVTVLPVVIGQLKRKGYTFVTLDELAEVQAARAVR